MVQKPVGESEINVIENEVGQLSVGTKTLVNEIPKLFLRKGKTNDNKMKN